eukprot:gene3672-6486_t
MPAEIEYTSIGKASSGGGLFATCSVGCLFLSCILGICCCLCLIATAGVAGAAGYGIYYVYPRIPTVKQDGFNLIQFSVDPNANPPIIVQGTATFSANYTGMVPIPIESVIMDVKYKTQIVGKMNEKNVGTINPQATSTFTLVFNYRLTTSEVPNTVIQQMANDINNNGQIALDFDGTISVKYLVIPLSFPLKFSKNIKPT